MACQLVTHRDELGSIPGAIDIGLWPMVEIRADDTTAASTIDRWVHSTEILNLDRLFLPGPG